MAKTAATVKPEAKPVDPYALMLDQIFDATLDILSASTGLAEQFDHQKGTMGAARMADVYSAIKTLNDTVEERVKILKGLVERIKTAVLPETFEREGVTTVTTESGYRVTVSSVMRASLGEDKQAAMQWLRDNELGELIIETVNASTLSAAAKQMLLEGKELDPDLFRAAIMPTTSVTKVRK